MALSPLADRVVIKALEAESKTAGGIIIPDNAKEKPQKGEVVAVGPGKTDEKGNVIKLELKVGDKVLYGKYAGTEVNVDGKDLLIMRESDVLAKI
ncbi:MAG: co-chaperone GroES [Fibrobacterota bacterium]|nr:co-chaperone GroES [Fibrobacterota bacterium]QQS06059.1 MAG: co-chaperone GroES [Fibrobacterota bacterium]